MPQAPSDPLELARLTKSRQILARLEELGFWKERQEGSHIIMKAPSGGSVVVPNKPSLPVGTRHSIETQALNALEQRADK